MVELDGVGRMPLPIIKLTQTRCPSQCRTMGTLSVSVTSGYVLLRTDYLDLLVLPLRLSGDLDPVEATIS